VTAISRAHSFRQFSLNFSITFRDKIASSSQWSYKSPIDSQLLRNSVNMSKFHKNANSVAQLEIPLPAENCRPYYLPTCRQSIIKTVTTRQRPDLESNSQPLDCESNIPSVTKASKRLVPQNSQTSNQLPEFSLATVKLQDISWSSTHVQ